MINKISNYLSEKYQLLGIFTLIFLHIFLSQKLYTNSGSTGNVEQWINITNSIFYSNQDFLFSYGPMYWIVGGVTSSFSLLSYWVSVLFISFVITLFWFLVFTNLYKSRTYFYFAITYFLFIGTLNFPASFFLWPILLIIYIDNSDKKLELLSFKNVLIISVVIAFFFYIRFFYGLIAFLSFGSYFFIQFFSKKEFKKIIYAFIIFLFSFILFGLLIFKDYGNIFNYLLINSQLSFGNSVDMTMDVANSNFTFKLVGLIFILFNIYLLLQNRKLFITINILLLLFLKLGFSRIDHYFHYFVIPVSMLALLMTFYKGRLNKIIFVLITVCLYFLSTNSAYSGATIYDGFDKLKAPINFEKKYEDRIKDVYVDKYRLNQDILDLIGNSTIDVYPYNNEYLFANKLNYLHRPSFQNYMTLTPKLDEMNKNFFESNERPKFILWTAPITCTSEYCNPFSNFDNKNILNEDPLTTISILQNYHIVKVLIDEYKNIPIVLFQSNEQNLKYDTQILKHEQMEFNKWYEVPNTKGVIKLIPNFKFTIKGRLKNLLFRGSIVKIKYKTFDDKLYEHRLNLVNTKSGIWISPLPNDFTFVGDNIKAIMITTESNNYIESIFESQWIQVEMPLVSKKELNKFLENRDIFSFNTKSISCEGSIDNVNDKPLVSKLINPGFLNISGWTALSPKDGKVFDKIISILTNEKGEKIFLNTQKVFRQDLINAFNQPNLLYSGYHTLVDTSKLKDGKYTLMMAGVYDSNIYTCDKNLYFSFDVGENIIQKKEVN